VKVAWFVSADYPDMDEVIERLKKAAATEHEILIRKGENVIRPLMKGMGIEFTEVAIDRDYYGDGSYSNLARDLEMLNDSGYVIVYTTPANTTTKFVVKKATERPYSFIYGSKVEINEKKSRKSRSVQKTGAQIGQQRKKAGQAQASNSAAGSQWRMSADAWIATKPSGYIFWSDEATQAVGPGGQGAVGAWFSGLAKAGILIDTGRRKPSEAAEKNGREIREWRKV